MKNLIEWIEDFLQKIYSRIIDNTYLSSNELGLFRIVIGIYFLVKTPQFSWLNEVPPSLYRPKALTLTSVFQSFPPPEFFTTFDAVIPLLLCLLMLGILTRICSLTLFVLLAIGYSFSFSFGKIDHNIFSILIFLLLGFCNSGSKYAILPEKKWNLQPYALSIFAICIVFAFFTAGYEKAQVWLDFNLDTSGINSWFYQGYFNSFRNKLLADYFFSVSPFIKELMEYSAVIFEITGIVFLLISRRTWYLYLILASLFHLVNTLILNIQFLDHVVVYGIWILSPMLVRQKWFVIIFIIPLLLKGLWLSVALWSILLIASLISWKKGFYSFSEKKSYWFKIKSFIVHFTNMV